ncbi:hypothetical protein D3C75_1201000 [compost metagenome]
MKRYFRAGKAAVNRVHELEPELATVRDELKRTRMKADRADDLRDALDNASDRARHWEAVAQAHMPQPAQQSVMHVPGDKKKKFDMPDFDAPSV